MRIVVFILNALIQLSAAAVGFFLLLLGLNGFGERQATPGIIFYIVMCVLSALAPPNASALTANRLAAKQSLGNVGGSLISVMIFSVVGVVVLVVIFFAAVFIAAAMRGSR